MEDAPRDFDAADLADAILGSSDPNWVAVATLEMPAATPPPAPPPRRRSNGLGWVLLLAAFIAVSVAVSLAVQLDPTRPSPQPPECGGLFATECCTEDDLQRGDEFGLFDEEEHFSIDC